MSWDQVTDADVRMNPAELAMLNNITGSPGVRADVLGNVINEFRDALAAAGTPLGPDGTVPGLVRMHVVNRTRWLWLCEFPQMKAFQTDGRKALNDSAETALKDIAARVLKAPPGDGSVADQTVTPSFGKFPHRQFTRRRQDG